MNYATDRRDRRARQSNLIDDFHQALATQNHRETANILRDVGWNHHALFHYNRGNCINDYAQMLELSGYPVSAMIVLLQYRTNERDDKMDLFVENNGATVLVPATALADDWLQQPYHLMQNRHCGCGQSRCGKPPCIQLRPDSILYSALRTYLTDLRCRKPPPAAEIVRFTTPDPCPLPNALQFWNDTPPFQRFSPLLCLLTIKILYLVIPVLAMDALPYLNFTPLQQQEFANNQKSHWAYYIFIRAIAFGQRVKASKRQHHVPVWDTFWKMVHDDHPWNDGDDFLARLLQPRFDEQPLYVWNHLPPLYLVGDSHVLSLAWQTLTIDGTPRLIVPILVTGLKAWHLRSGTRFFTHSCFQRTLQRLATSCSTLLLSAGEIDCREGIGGQLLEGYTKETHHVVQHAACEFVRALGELLDWTILVLPVAPHLYRTKKGRHAAQVSRRTTMKVWNESVSKLLPRDKVWFLDYVDAVRAPGDEYILNPVYNADSTHMNNGFLTILEHAIHDCGCDMRDLEILK